MKSIARLTRRMIIIEILTNFLHKNALNWQFFAFWLRHGWLLLGCSGAMHKHEKKSGAESEG
jgi:hypothetical protein